MNNPHPRCFLNLAVVLFPSLMASQVLVESSPFNTYLLESRSIATGTIDPYLGMRFSYEWRSTMPDGTNDLLRSKLTDDWLRKDRLKFYPAIEAVGSLQGGHLTTKTPYLDISPVINVVSRYTLSPWGKYRLLFWARIEDHLVITQKKIPDFKYDFAWRQEIGKYGYHRNDSTWIEYRIGDGGILFTHPKGDVVFGQSNPIWGTGYTGQLWLSNKAPSYVFLGFRHRVANKWTFSYFHGSLNSTMRDSTHMDLYPLKRSLPLIRKNIAAHRLDFSPRANVRVGFGESIIYGVRSVELAYALPFLFYWTVEPDLGDSDNLQMFLDFEAIKEDVGRVYGSIYLDEWDFVDTFNKEESRNWAAYQIGLTYDVPLAENWSPLVRVEFTHLTPYVYVHKSSINMFQHHGQYLGFWSGPNSDNLFLAVEGSPRPRWWLQLYGQRTRRGEVNNETIKMMYNLEKVPFLYRTYEGEPETRILLGLRGQIDIFSNIRLNLDLYHSSWSQRFDRKLGNRPNQNKFDVAVQVALGL